MIHLLIDTSTFRQLISKIEVNPHLMQIKQWVDHQELQILVPEIIKREWIKHKEIEKDKISKVIKEHAKELKKSKLFGLEISEHATSSAQKILFSQIEIIDELLEAGSAIATTPSAKIKAIDYADEGLAPFHNKKESNNDALFFFSTLDFLVLNNFNTLYFISANHNDFGSVDDPHKSIHQDLVKDYPNIQIIYRSEIANAILTIQTLNGLSRVSADKNELLLSKHSPIKIDRSMNIIYQLNDYVKKRYAEISFYPPHLLIKDYPFRVDDDFNSNYRSFSLRTDNIALENLCRNIELVEGQPLKLLNDFSSIENGSEHVTQALLNLNYNLVFYFETDSEKIDVRLLTQPHCECVKCRFFKFSFSPAFEALSLAHDDELQMLLKQGFIHYQVGNFLMAYEKFKLCLDSAEKTGKLLTKFLCVFNLKKLSIFIKNHYWSDRRPEDILKLIEGFNLSDFPEKGTHSYEKEFIEWMKSNAFYDDARAEIYSLNKKIKNSYYTQLYGGHSSNDYITRLVNAFGCLDYFLTLNFIVYDAFTEFAELFEVVLDSLLMSYAIPPSQGSRLRIFDDYVVKKIVYYANPDTLLTLINRYHINEIMYEKSSPPGATFLELCHRFFDDTGSIASAFNNNCEKDNLYFWDNYGRYFTNILILGNYLSISDQERGALVEKAVGFIERYPNRLNPTHDKQLVEFIWHQNKYLNRDHRERLVELFWRNNQLHSERFFDLGVSLLEDIKVEGVSEKTFDTIMISHFDKCECCSKRHKPQSISIWYKICNPVQRKIITDRIEGILVQNFVFDVYYFAAMHEVIDWKIYFKQFLNESIDAVVNRHPDLSIFRSPKGRRYSALNMLINLCFKFGVDMSGNEFDSIRKVDPYYRWLLDMDNFNYSNFNAYWVTEYNTVHYNDKFATSTQLRNALDACLKKDNNPFLLRRYFRIYSKD